jgi:hypothetical protein
VIKIEKRDKIRNETKRKRVSADRKIPACTKRERQD